MKKLLVIGCVVVVSVSNAPKGHFCCETCAGKMFESR